MITCAIELINCFSSQKKKNFQLQTSQNIKIENFLNTKFSKTISGQLEVQVLYLDKKLFGSHWPSFLLSSCTARKCTSTWAFLYLSFHAYSNTWSDLFRLTFLVTSVVRRIFKQKMSRIGPFLIKVSNKGTFLCFGSLRIWLVTLDLTMISFLMTEQKQFNVH